MGKGPFYRLLSKIFLTTGGFLSALSLLYAQTTIDPPEPWNFREIALFPLSPAPPRADPGGAGTYRPGPPPADPDPPAPGVAFPPSQQEKLLTPRRARRPDRRPKFWHEIWLAEAMP